jgi:hypothetical protein
MKTESILGTNIMRFLYADESHNMLSFARLAKIVVGYGQYFSLFQLRQGAHEGSKEKRIHTVEISRSDTEQVAARLKSASKSLHNMAQRVARALQIREFMPERKKNLLAYHMRGYIEADMSIAKAEALARTRYEYIEELNDLMKQLEAAELVIHQYKPEQASCGSRQMVI